MGPTAGVLGVTSIGFRCIYLCKPGPNIVPEPKPHDPKCWMEEANRWVRGVTKPTLTVTQPTPRRGEWPPAASPDDTRHTMCCWLVSAGQHRSVAAPGRLSSQLGDRAPVAAPFRSTPTDGLDVGTPGRCNRWVGRWVARTGSAGQSWAKHACARA